MGIQVTSEGQFIRMQDSDTGADIPWHKLGREVRVVFDASGRPARLVIDALAEMRLVGISEVQMNVVCPRTFGMRAVRAIQFADGEIFDYGLPGGPAATSRVSLAEVPTAPEPVPGSS